MDEGQGNVDRRIAKVRLFDKGQFSGRENG
jgi:hypothetical protein